MKRRELKSVSNNYFLTKSRHYVMHEKLGPFIIYLYYYSFLEDPHHISVLTGLRAGSMDDEGVQGLGD